MQQQEPQDAIPPQYAAQPQQPYAPQPPQHPYPAPQYYPPQQYAQPYPPPPVQVNVNQYAGGPVVVRKRVNHAMHFCLTLLTGGLWLVVWIPAAMRGGKTQVYR